MLWLIYLNFPLPFLSPFSPLLFLTKDEFGGNFRFEKTWKETFIKNKKGVNLLEKYRETKNQATLQLKIFSDVLYNIHLADKVDPNVWAFDNIERRSGMSLEQFREEFEKPNKPVIITDVIPSWPAFNNWTKNYLVTRHGEVIYKTDKEVEMKLADYFEYCEQVDERNPIYLFDEFHDKSPQLLEDYKVPLYFEQDLFSILPKEKRPKFRWILIGPKKSGLTSLTFFKKRSYLKNHFS